MTVRCFDSFGLWTIGDPLVPRVGGESCDSSMFRFVWIVDNRGPVVPPVGGESCDKNSVYTRCFDSFGLWTIGGSLHLGPSGAEKHVTQDSEVQNIVQNKFNLVSIMCVQE